jgi:zinc transport system substrate-binding protein
MKHYNITFKSLWPIVLCALFCFPAYANSAVGDKPLVVTSIKPLAIIAKSALQDRARVEYIMPSGLSPHDVVLKVSDMRVLAEADLVLWIGSDFEIRAAKQFASLPASKLMTAIDVIFPEHRTVDAEDMSMHTEHTEHTEHDEHNHDIDPHIWLSPTIASQLAKTLSLRLDMPVKDIFSERVKKETVSLLAPVTERNYMVHHQGHGYFVDEFNLQAGLSIRDMLGKQKGAKTQFNLRLEGEKLGVSCVFVEPQHGYKDAAAIAKDLSVPTTKIDILAVDYGDQLPSYESYIYSLATQFSACFK